ncbi:MAG: hypothetical protein V2I33_07855 [Kangiellaceae bacterium]|jgi:MSHA biogenesis protein MshP|nr:hypothetical protein [Kangiellaceae bacterium]
MSDSFKQLTSNSRGFSIFAALFIIIVVGLLAGTILRMTQTSEVAVAQETLSIRAFFAAESGVQAVAMQIFPLTGGGFCNNQVINFAANGLTNCRATITCNAYVADGENYYQVVSQGQCSSGELQASRTIESLMRDI